MPPRPLNIPINTIPLNRGQRPNLNVLEIVCRIVCTLSTGLWQGTRLFSRLCMALIASPCSLCIVLVFAAIFIGFFGPWLSLNLKSIVFTGGGLTSVFNNGYFTEALAALEVEHLFNLKRVRNAQELTKAQYDADTAKKHAKNEKQAKDIEARTMKHKLDEQEHNLTGKIQNSDYNEVSTAERIESYSYFWQFYPDITYQPATCKISQVKYGAYKFCLSPEEDPKPLTPPQCGFECVPELSLAEYEAAMVIYRAKDRLGEFYRNSDGVKAWFKLFNVIGHDNAKAKFAQVFDKELGIVCSGLKGSHLESVKNVCGSFYEKPTLLLSNNQHRIAATAAVHDL